VEADFRWLVDLSPRVSRSFSMADRNHTARHPHVPELQSIRGIAAFVVMLGHCASYYIAPKWFHTAELVLANGDGAVVLFFVLSGYVLANLLSKSPLNGKTVVSFYIRRLFRIYPALWLASLLALVYVVFFHYRIPVADASPWFAARFKVERYSLVGIAASMAGALAFLLPPVWSIFVEMVGSVLMPACRLTRDNGRLAFLVLGACLFALSFMLGPYTYYNVATYMLDFWLGAAAFYALAQPSGRRVPPAGVQISAMLAALGIFLAGQFVDQPGINPPLTLAYALASVLLLVAVLRSWVGVGFLRAKWLVRLGDWSYSVYLLHFSVMCFAAKGLQVAGASSLPTVARSCLLIALTAIVTVPLSAASYRIVELPGIALGNRLIAKLQLRPPLRSAPARGPSRLGTR
jgi:peptidoglycan/LPS O-acetylase OafA/YrhL